MRTIFYTISREDMRPIIISKRKSLNENSPVLLDTIHLQEVINKFRLHDKDCASADVQIAVITERLKELESNLQYNPKDTNSRLAMIKMVAHRRKLLNYLNSTDTKRYQILLKKLGISQ